MCGPQEEFQLNGKKALSSHSTRAKDRSLSAERPIALLSVSGKVFAHILLARIQPLLDKCRRPQQSGFTAGRSTMHGCHISLEIVGRVTPKF